MIQKRDCPNCVDSLIVKDASCCTELPEMVSLPKTFIENVTISKTLWWLLNQLKAMSLVEFQNELYFLNLLKKF